VFIEKKCDIIWFYDGDFDFFIRNSLAPMLILLEKFPRCLTCRLTIGVFQKEGVQLRI
jgi:hypothetical protein